MYDLVLTFGRNHDGKQKYRITPESWGLGMMYELCSVLTLAQTNPSVGFRSHLLGPSCDPNLSREGSFTRRGEVKGFLAAPFYILFSLYASESSIKRRGKKAHRAVMVG